MPYPVALIIEELARRAGMEDFMFDVSGIDPTLSADGFLTTNAYAVAGSLVSLAQIFYFDPSSHGGAVRFIPRGLDTVASLVEDEIVDDDEGLDQDRRADAIAVARVLNLNYQDADGGLVTDKQTSERFGDRRAVGEVNLSSPVVMTADVAARALAIAHKIQIEDQRGELEFSLPDSFISLTPGDAIFLTRGEKTERFRIARVDIFEGLQRVVVMHDRQSAYTSDIEGIPAAPSTPPPSSIVGEALLEILDIPMQRDAHDILGYYVAIAGEYPAWTGALIERSVDGGANYTDALSWDGASVIGELTSALADHPVEFPDEVNVCTVEILTDAGELEATDLPGMFNGLNYAMIGNELVQFADADETSPGIWELSYFLRGRKGTAAVAHSTGARFVLLDNAAQPLIPAELLDLGRTLTFRATSFGLTVADATIVAITYAGVMQIERQPGYVAVRRDGTSVVIDWQGVGRLGGGAQAAHGVRFAGYRVTVTDGANEVITDTVSLTHTQSVSGWSSPITVRVAQRNDMTGAGPYTEVSIA